MKTIAIILLLVTIGCSPRKITIYPPDHCVDVDKWGYTYPINTHFPVVDRRCS